MSTIIRRESGSGSEQNSRPSHRIGNVVTAVHDAIDKNWISFWRVATRGRIEASPGNVIANMDSFALINKYHVARFAYFIDKLASIKEADGTVLDHSMILYGSSMSNGNQHDHDPLPIVLLGGASGQLQGNRHIVAPVHTPMSNLLLSMLDKLGVHQNSFGDSTSHLGI